MSLPVRVLLVDDSRVHRTALASLLNRAADVDLIGVAGDGEEGVLLAQRLRPDVILMDVQMPKLDGLEATREIMATSPTPILLMTAAENLAREVDLGMRAMALGALDLIPKPNLEDLRTGDDLVRRLRLLAKVPVISHPRGRRGPGIAARADRRPTTGYFKRASRLVAIVSSTGGPRALTVLLGGLPPQLKAAVVVVQHIDAAFEEGLVRWLDEHCPLEVVLAKDRMELLEGRVYLAPQGRYAEVTDARRVALVEDPEEIGSHCPSGDRLLRSAAHHYANRAVGVVLTGMGRDGAEGLLAIRQAGGITLAQDEASSVVYGMPQAAAQNGAAQRVLPIDRLAAAVVEALA